MDTKRSFTEDELSTYSGLLYQARIPSTVSARTALAQFEEQHGNAKIDEMFAELCKRDSVN